MIAVVIPCYRVKSHILSVLSAIGPEVKRIFVVDDACPEQSGAWVESQNRDPRVKVLRNAQNQGVGGAMKTGFRAALAEGAEIVVKIDGDGQMDPKLLPEFVRPIQDGTADFTKGNRFHELSSLQSMPKVRLLGNSGLSFLTKLSSGYWNIMDPTNGYLAISGRILKQFPLQKLADRYFFESDLLFRLYLARAVIFDVPMEAHYGTEKSNLSVTQVLIDFPPRHFACFLKRLGYSYFLRDFNVGSISLLFGTLLTAFGAGFGISQWLRHFRMGLATPSGTVMVAALPVILGFQLLLAFLNFDVQNVPRRR